MSKITQRTVAFLPYLTVAVACGFFVFYPLTDGDIFWHCAAGRQMLAQKTFLFTDPFSYSVPGARWIDVHWVFQLIVFGVQHVAGWWGLIFFQSCVVGTACALLLKSVPLEKALHTWFMAALMILAVFECRYLLPLRPITLTIFFLVLYIVLLERYRENGGIANLILLTPIQILWVNCQGLFVLGIVIVACYAAGDLTPLLFRRGTGNKPSLPNGRIGMLFLFFPILTAASLLSPYSWSAFGLSATLFHRIDPAFRNIYSTNIPENLPLMKLPGTPSVFHFWGVAAIVLLLCIVVVRARRSVHVPLILISGAFLALAFMAQRNIPLFFFVALPCIAVHLDTVANGPGPKRRATAFPGIMVAALIPAIVLPVAIHAMMLAECWPGPIAPFSFPSGSISYLRQHPVSGNLFNADRHGGYLIWERFPTSKVFIDTRLAIRSREFFARYLAVLDTPSQFDGLRARFGITQVILPAALVDRYMRLAARLYRDPEWRLVYADGSELLFVVDSLAPGKQLRLESAQVDDSVSTDLARIWHDKPVLAQEALLHWKTLLATLTAKSLVGD